MAAKLKPSFSKPSIAGPTSMPAQILTREIKDLVVQFTGDGDLYLREKGRKLIVGPFKLSQLYQDGIQRQAGHAPLKPRTPRKGSKQVTRGLLATGDGK